MMVILLFFQLFLLFMFSEEQILLNIKKEPTIRYEMTPEVMEQSIDQSKIVF